MFSILANLLLSLTITTATVAERPDNSLIAERISYQQSQKAFSLQLEYLCEDESLPSRLQAILTLNGDGEAIQHIAYMVGQL